LACRCEELLLSVLTVLDQIFIRFWSIRRKQILLPRLQVGEPFMICALPVAENPIDHPVRRAKGMVRQT
jgi:hypothetical protein